MSERRDEPVGQSKHKRMADGWCITHHADCARSLHPEGDGKRGSSVQQSIPDEVRLEIENLRRDEPTRKPGDDFATYQYARGYDLGFNRALDVVLKILAGSTVSGQGEGQ